MYFKGNYTSIKEITNEGNYIINVLKESYITLYGMKLRNAYRGNKSIIPHIVSSIIL